MADDLIEFLEARIAEDEMKAAYVREYGDTGGVFSPDRVLVECAAKRLIIAEHGLDDHSTKDYCEVCADWPNCEVGEGPPGVEYPCPTLRALAIVYVGHPGYNREWSLNAI